MVVVSLEYSRIPTCLNKTAVENILLWRIIDVKKIMSLLI
jgi:hypothetical protein